MSAYDPTRRPGGREPLPGALPDDLSADDELARGEEEVAAGDREGEAPPARVPESGEEAIDERGRNPTQRAIEADDDADRPVR